MQAIRIDPTTGLFIEDVLDADPAATDIVTTSCPGGFHHPKWDGVAWVEGKPDVAAAAKLAHLNAYAKTKRNHHERSGTVSIPLGGVSVPFDADFDSLTRVGGAARKANRAIRGSQALSISWIDANNTARTLTAADLEALDDAIATKIETAHGVYRQVKADLAAGTVTSEAGIDAYPWP